MTFKHDYPYDTYYFCIGALISVGIHLHDIHDIGVFLLPTTHIIRGQCSYLLPSR